MKHTPIEVAIAAGVTGLAVIALSHALPRRGRAIASLVGGTLLGGVCVFPFLPIGIYGTIMMSAPDDFAFLSVAFSLMGFAGPPIIGAAIGGRYAFVGGRALLQTYRASAQLK